MAVGTAITDSEFQQKVLSFPGVSIVDFWADWCTPCKMLEPALAEIASDMAGKGDFQLVSVDADTNPETAGGFGIMSLPTLLFIKGGVVRAQLVGVRPKDQIVEVLDRVMAE